MLDRVTLRRSAIAYLYRETLPLGRDENLKFYDRVTASGVDIPQFSIQGSELALLRPPTPVAGPLEIRVGAFGVPPQLRLLVNEVPVDRPSELVWETADLVWDAFRTVWGSRVAEPNLTEVTLEFSAPAPGGDSRGFLTESVARIDPAAFHHLGRDFEGFGLRFMSGPSISVGPGPQPVLPGTDVQMRIETLMNDLTQLFIQTTIKWPPLNVPVNQLPPQIREHVEGSVVQANLKAEKPGHYLRLSHDFVVKNLVAFLRHTSE
jgi:hypothetical protein